MSGATATPAGTRKRLALLIGNATFPDEPSLAALVGPPNDVRLMAGVLGNPELGGFEIKLLEDQVHHELKRHIARACVDVARDGCLLIYYSGHGKLDSQGRLCLATKDTDGGLLLATSLPMLDLRGIIENANCRQVIIILDCCYSGSAGTGSGLKGDVNSALGALQGSGIYMMTASTGTQAAHEDLDEKVSVFTRHLSDGIASGAADMQGKGHITVDDLYAYVHGKVVATGRQEPMKWDLGAKGEMQIARAAAGPIQKMKDDIRQRVLALSAQQILPDRVVGEIMEFLGTVGREPRAAQSPQFAVLRRWTTENTPVGRFVDDWLALETQQRQDHRSPASPLKAPQADNMGTTTITPATTPLSQWASQWATMQKFLKPPAGQPYHWWIVGGWLPFIFASIVIITADRGAPADILTLYAIGIGVGIVLLIRAARTKAYGQIALTMIGIALLAILGLLIALGNYGPFSGGF